MAEVKLDPDDYEAVFEEQQDDKGLVVSRKLLMITLTASGQRKAKKLLGDLDARKPDSIEFVKVHP